MDIAPKLKRKLKKLWKTSRMGQARDHLADRQRLAACIAKYAENGQVAVVYGGVDCDGGRWDNCVTILPAMVMAVTRWENDYFAGAEGPQWCGLERPSEVVSLEETHRDLALEAFENGHPHVLYY